MKIVLHHLMISAKQPVKNHKTLDSYRPYETSLVDSKYLQSNQ